MCFLTTAIKHPIHAEMSIKLYYRNTKILQISQGHNIDNFKYFPAKVYSLANVEDRFPPVALCFPFLLALISISRLSEKKNLSCLLVMKAC